MPNSVTESENEFTEALLSACSGLNSEEPSQLADAEEGAAYGDGNADPSRGPPEHPLSDDETMVKSMRRNVNRVKDIIRDPDMDSRLEKLFKLSKRGTTWEMEVYCGVIQFISCVYVLPVVPLQLKAAGFNIGDTISITVSGVLWRPLSFNLYQCSLLIALL
jgi:hypothetical protein